MIGEAGPTAATHASVLSVGAGGDPTWIKVIRQDDVAAPDEFPTIRMLLGSRFFDGKTTHFNLGIDLYRREPREYPPGHCGDASVGLNLDVVEATALRDALSVFIAQEQS